MFILRCVEPPSCRLEGKCNVGQLVMMAGHTNISKVVDMEAVRAAVLSCQRFTALYLCSLKLCVCVTVCDGLGLCVLFMVLLY